ncbi:MAG: hypothetical protein PHH26_03930 [Candidatus Thermoplasmatota archaeon]|nr:hypothetical protein [Candidatus Thermoplasmatota archaeon]
MEVITFSVGIVIGIIGTAAAIEISQRWITKKKSSTGLAHFWSISEIPNPVVVAKSLEGASLPAGTRVVCATEPPQEILSKCKVRINPDADANFAAGKSTALVFSGGLSSGTAAISTVDEVLVASLNAEFEMLWDKGTPIHETLSINEALSKHDGEVKIRGQVSLVTKFKDGQHILQISEEGGASVGVLVDSFPEGITGKTIEVIGTMDPIYGGGVLRPRQVRIIQ